MLEFDFALLFAEPLNTIIAYQFVPLLAVHPFRVARRMYFLLKSYYTIREGAFYTTTGGDLGGGGNVGSATPVVVTGLTNGRWQHDQMMKVALHTPARTDRSRRLRGVLR